MYKTYQVKSGDTLAKIAVQLGISPEVLASLNGVNITTPLNPNTYIVVPKGNSYFNNYKVKKGDTIYGIANKNNVDPNQLLKLNGLNQNDIIYPDDEILLPNDQTGFYVTIENDTINGLTQKLRIPIETIAKQNETIYLMPDQLLVYKK